MTDVLEFFKSLPKEERQAFLDSLPKEEDVTNHEIEFGPNTIYWQYI
jgi:hypothetical protein